MTNEIKDAEKDDGSMSFVDFLQSVHPSQEKGISDLVATIREMHGTVRILNRRPIKLHCPVCGGARNYRIEGDRVLPRDESRNIFLQYRCGDCQQQKKFFSLRVTFQDAANGLAYKYGEKPAFGIPIPNRLLRLFDADKDLLFKGRQCENQGLGIAAFAYYRRVVEHQKDNILDEFVKVSEIIGVSNEVTQAFRAAKEEISFSKAIGSIKPALPEAFLINGYNPLTLLHTALSKGLHNDDDADCLEIAHSVRLVLTEMGERFAQLKKDDKELATALLKLVK